MKSPRRKRSDSLAAAQRILASAEAELAPPAHVPLDDAAWPFWHSLVDEYARADWTPHMLEVAALLSRTMAQLEVEQRAMRTEGMVIFAGGRCVPNPRNRIVGNLTANVLAYRRSLALTGRAKAGSSEDAAAHRVANRRTETRLRGLPDDQLLAAPIPSRPTKRN